MQTLKNILDTAVPLAVDAGLLVVAVGILLCVYRLVKGPHLIDRALAVDTIAIHLIALVILLTIRLDSLLLFDGVMVLSLLGFAGSAAIAYYVARPHLRKRVGERISRNPDE